MMNRIMGVLTLKAPTYREIADDKNATMTAGIIVVVMALLSAILTFLFTGAIGAAVGQPSAASPLRSAIQTILSVIIGWFVGSWVFAFVSKTFFGGKTNTGEMLRVFGYAQVFSILNIVPVCGSIAALVLSVIAAVIGIREASEFDTTKAILTGLVGLVIIWIVTAIIAFALAAVGVI
ncbi:MAG TPA: YIP1 family protein [Anaerolineae bacterium]